MSNPISTSDEEFLNAFIECRLSPASFDHRGHLRVAWLMLSRHPREQAIELICNGIQRLAGHFGAADKYNRTVSEAIMQLMAERRTAMATPTFEGFIEENPVFLTGLKHLLAQHYSTPRLYSVEAKQHFLAPDRQPLF